jgi:5-methylcytosine-specific restriction endonuclease McrA
MTLSVLSDITFDEQDANLFLVDDARLRADALKHSVLPRLRVVMNSAIALMREVYGIEVLDDSIVSVFPNFREKRYKDNELTHQYDSVFVGLGGQRKAKWPGFSRKDRKPVQILPFRFAFMLTEEGVFTCLENAWLKGLDKKSFDSILRFHIENENTINRLCFGARIRPDFYFSEGLPFFSAFQDHYQHRISNGEIDNHFVGYPYHLPVSPVEISEMVENFAVFFPVYDSYIQIAKGLSHRLNALVSRLNDWFVKQLERQNEAGEERHSSTDESAALAALSAEQKIRVMPAIRWQVFQRDQWKCVSCGRNSHNGAILHVDHIIPRSRGGLDSLSNYQTLCDLCNIGKSNRDATDLRNKG